MVLSARIALRSWSSARVMTSIGDEGVGQGENVIDNAVLTVLRNPLITMVNSLSEQAILSRHRGFRRQQLAMEAGVQKILLGTSPAKE